MSLTLPPSFKQIAKKTVASIALVAPSFAFAAYSPTTGISFGDIAANASKSTAGVFNLMNDGAMVLGFFLVLLGLWLFYQSKQDDGRTKKSHAAAAVVIGTLMIFIPFVIESTGKTLGGGAIMRQAPTTSIQ